jgi:nucleoside-diphosphate-sugar epimerase
MIFILGGRGLVGSGFARYCERTGKPFQVIHRENYASCAGQSCDLLINANGNSSKVLSRRDPKQDFDASVSSVRASLEDFRCKRYVHVSSCDVYPDCSSPESTREELPLDPSDQTPYGFHKRLAEQCVQHAADDWLILRCGGFVGPGLKKNAIYDILQGGPLFLDPSSELQFLHTDRAAEIVFRLIEQGIGREIFNLCGKGLVRLQEVIDRKANPVPVNPESPKVRYQVSIDKLLALVDVPSTREEVFEFVNSEPPETEVTA